MNSHYSAAAENDFDIQLTVDVDPFVSSGDSLIPYPVEYTQQVSLGDW